MRLKAFLTDHGFKRVSITKTAADARELLMAKQDAKGVDKTRLIIINNDLEDADGYELCREIHKIESYKNTYKIMLISSTENKQAIIKSQQSGANDFAVKPYENIEFYKHLSIFSSKKVVLLVEDDPVIRQMVSLILYKRNIELVTEDDGVDAYNIINTMVPPRLVIMDIGLPRMNGIKLVKHIRTKKTWKKTPVLMLTGSTEVKDVNSSLISGANEYIVKPFNIDAFSLRIDKYFDDIKHD